MSDERYIIVVTGSPRSGTSLMMRMLLHGGVPVHADNHVSFEANGDMGRIGHEWGFLDGCYGKAVKILEPLYAPPPEGHRYRFIMMTRNKYEQAKSWVKFMKTVGMDGVDDDDIQEKLRLSLERDQTPMRDMLSRLGNGIDVSFEDALADPVAVGIRLRAFLDIPNLDIPSMARQVVKRGPECLPYMLEEQQQDSGIVPGFFHDGSIPRAQRRLR